MPNQLPYGSDPFAGLYPEPELSPEPVINPGPKTASGTKVFGVAAKQNIGGAAGGLLGAAGAGALAGTFAGGLIGTVGGFAIGLGGALLGSYLGNEAQTAIDPTYEEDAQWLAEQYPEHKWAAIGGALAPNLVGMRPSLAPLKQLGTIRGTLAKQKAGGALGGSSWRNLTAEQQNALLNVGAGVGLGVAPSVNNLVQGRDVDIAELLAGVGSGALLTQPWGVARKLGMHPSLSPEEEYAAIHDLVVAKSLQDAPAPVIPDQAIPQIDPQALAQEELLQRGLRGFIAPTDLPGAPVPIVSDDGILTLIKPSHTKSTITEEGKAKNVRVPAEQVGNPEALPIGYNLRAAKGSQKTAVEKAAIKEWEALLDAETRNKAEARKLARSEEQFSPGAEMRDEVPTMGEARAAEYLREKNKIQSEDYHKAYARLARETRGVETMEADFPEAGKFTPDPRGPGKIETGKGRGFGTGPHEQTHAAAWYLKSSPRKQDNRLHDLTIEAIQNDPKYQAWKAAADEQNARKGWKYSTEPEEYWAREAGAAKDLRIFDETPEVRNQRDRETATRVVDGTASVDDYVRYANNLMQYGPSFQTVMQRYGGKFGQLNAPIQQSSIGAQTPDEPELKVTEQGKRGVIDDAALKRITAMITKHDVKRVMDETGKGRTEAIGKIRADRAEAEGVGPQGFDVPETAPDWLKPIASGVSLRGAKKALEAGKTLEDVRGYGIEKPRSFQLAAKEKAKQHKLSDNDNKELLRHAFDAVKRKLSEENRKTGFGVKFDSYQLDDGTVINPLRKSAEEGVGAALEGRWSVNTKAAPNTPEFMAHLKDQAGKLAISRYRELRKAQVETMAGTKAVNQETQSRSVEAEESLDATLAGEEAEAGVDYNLQTEVPQRTAAAEQRFSRQANEDLGYRVSDQLKDTVSRAVKTLYGEPPDNVARLAREILENTDYRYDNLVDALKKKNAPGTDKILKDLAEAIERQEFAQRDLTPQSDFVRLVQQWARSNDMRDFGRGTRINDYNNLAYEIYNDPEMFLKFQDKVRAVGTQDDWNTLQDAIAIRKRQTVSNRIAKERGEGVLAPRPPLHYRDELVPVSPKPETLPLPEGERTYEERGFKPGEKLPELPGPEAITLPEVSKEVRKSFARLDELKANLDELSSKIAKLREAHGVLNKEEKIAGLRRQWQKLNAELGAIKIDPEFQGTPAEKLAEMGVKNPAVEQEVRARTEELSAERQDYENRLQESRDASTRAGRKKWKHAQEQYSPAAAVPDSPQQRAIDERFERVKNTLPTDRPRTREEIIAKLKSLGPVEFLKSLPKWGWMRTENSELIITPRGYSFARPEFSMRQADEYWKAMEQVPVVPKPQHSISSMVPDLFKAEIDLVKRLDPDLGKAFERADRSRARLTGYLNNEPLHLLQNELALKPEGRDNKTFMKDLLANDSPDHRYAMWYRDQIMSGKKPNVTLTPRQQRINDAVELILKRTYDEREKNPLTKHGTKQKAGYLPGMMDLKIAREIEVNRSGKIAQDAIKAQEDWLAAEYGRGSKEFKDRMGRFLGAFDKKQMNSAEQFGPIDLNEGIGLAPELRDKNLNRLMSRFARRFAERMAFANEVQADQKAMARLQDDKVSLKSNPHVKNVLDRMNGVTEEQEEVRMAISGAIRSMMLQTKTGLGDVTTSFPITMKHLSAKQLGGAGMAWARGAYEGLTRKGDLFRETLRQGINVDNSTTMEMGEDTSKNIANVLNGVRNITNKATGRNWLEQISRAGVYEEGKWLATENVKAVLDGTANAQQKKFVDDFFDKPEFTPEAIKEAATRFVETNQGTYGYRGLPSISEKGSLAPFLSLSRWNIEQMNNFDKFVFQPALKGNYEPLLMATLGALIGGAAVEQLYEIVSNRKSRLPTVSEIGASKQPVKGTLYKLAGIASLSGFAGFYGDIARTVGDVNFGNRAQGLTNPLWNGMQDFAGIVSDFTMAVADGNIEDAVTQIFPVLLQTYVQDARLLMAHADDAEMNRRDSFRDVRMFNALNEGSVTRAIADQPNPFTNVGLRKFKKTSDLSEAAELLPGLLEGAVGRSGGDPEKIDQEFGKLKANSYQTMPSPQRRPLEFARYMEYLTKTQGPEAAAERFVDYQKQNAINQAKTAMVP